MKIYTTFPFFKVAIAITAVAILLLLGVEILLGYNVLLAGLGFLLLFYLVLTFRIVQLIYKYQLDRMHDTNQVESTLWLYSRFTPTVSLPAMRDMAGSPDFLKAMVDEYYTHKPEVIVEVGSGVSSIILSETLMADKSTAKHYALDHLEKYADLTREKVKNANSEVLYAPLKAYTIDNQSWKWYDTSVLDGIDKIDMLVIDGPPENIQSMARYPALPLLMEKLSENAVIILDDTNRKDEQQIIKQWSAKYGLKAKFLYTEKGTCVLSK